MELPTVRCYLRVDGPTLPERFQEYLLAASRRFGASGRRFANGREDSALEYWRSPSFAERTFDGERLLVTMVQLLEEITAGWRQSWGDLELRFTVLLVFDCLPDLPTPGLEISADLLRSLAAFDASLELDVQA